MSGQEWQARGRPRHYHTSGYRAYKPYGYEGISEPDDRSSLGAKARVADPAPEQGNPYIKTVFYKIQQTSNGILLLLTTSSILLYYYDSKQGIIADYVDGFEVLEGDRVRFLKGGVVYSIVLAIAGGTIMQTQEIFQQEIYAPISAASRIDGYDITLAGYKVEFCSESRSFSAAIPIAYQFGYVVNDSLILASEQEMCYFQIARGYAILFGPFLFEDKLLGAIIDRYGHPRVIYNSGRYSFLEDLK